MADGSDQRDLDFRSLDGWVALSERVLRVLEFFAAVVLVLLFAIGVFDLGLGIFIQIRRGRITDPLVVIGFIDVALLLFIIVEVYQTVIAYTQNDETREIVRLVVYTGIIAMVRKAIIFRTGEYDTTMNALFAAIAYAVILLGLSLLLWTERVTPKSR